MKQFKIELPENPITKEEIFAKNRGMFNQDLQRGGILAKVFIFTYLNAPASTTEITEKLQAYYRIEFNRGTVYTNLKKLVDLGLLHTATSGDIFSTPENERKEIHEQILKKFLEFISKMPTSFRKRYDAVNYFWISNGDGMQYIEWCCNLLGFKIKEQKW